MGVAAKKGTPSIAFTLIVTLQEGMKNMGTSPYVTAMARAQLVTGFGIIVFWVLFFSGGLAPAHPPACYFTFEHAFPLPDTVLAIGLLIAGTLAIKGKSRASTLSLVCAGGLLFLGLLDASFNLQNGIYTSNFAEGAMAIAINLWCIALSIAIGVVTRSQTI